VKHIWADDVPTILKIDAEIRSNGYAFYRGHNNLLMRLVRFGYLKNNKKDRYTWTDDGARLPARIEAARKSEGAAP
jgi:hypothetical protein